jgi:hypothetical protein
LVRSALRGGAHPLSHQITNLSVSPKRQFRSETRPLLIVDEGWLRLKKLLRLKKMGFSGKSGMQAPDLRS